jgi:hypothetical protein
MQTIIALNQREIVPSDEDHTGVAIRTYDGVAPDDCLRHEVLLNLGGSAGGTPADTANPGTLQVSARCAFTSRGAARSCRLA